MQGVVMAGGMGSRLRPLTIGRPKPLVPLVKQPVMAYIVDLLRHHGVDDVVATVQYLSESIMDYFEDGSARGYRMRYAVEETPLGTAGSVRNARDLITGTFCVISGDALTDFDLRQAYAAHRDRKALVTLVLHRVASPLEYGVVITDPDGRITAFQEKPSWGEVISDAVNTGIYIIEPEILDEIPADRPYDFSKDLFPKLLERGAPMYGVTLDGYWTDIGDLAEYRRASADLLRGKVRLPAPLGERIGANVFVGGDVKVAPDAQLYAPIYLGDGVVIGEGVVVHGPTSVDDFTKLDARSHVDRSFVWRSCYVGEGAEIRGAVIGRSCNIKRHAVLFEGVVIGDNCVIEQGAILHPDVRLWPNKEVASGATVRRSIIWGGKASRTLFGRYGVTGLVNVDLTPEFAARLGSAFASTLPLGSQVVINRDAHRSSRMLKRAVISGLPASGVNAWDTRSVPVPVARYTCRVSTAAGGMNVRLSPFDTRVVDIVFFDADGMNLSKGWERKLEGAFFREDFRRVYQDDIGTISYAPNVIERYQADFLDRLDQEAIRRRGFRLVVDYANASTSLVMPELLRQLECTVVTLNANVDENRMAVPRTELDDELRRLASITSAVEADLGVRFGVDGERAFIVDSRGRLVSPDRLAAALAQLVWTERPGALVATPASASGLFEHLASKLDGRVQRTRVDREHLTRASDEGDVALAIDAGGHIIFPDLHPAVDGMFGVARLLQALAHSEARLADVVDRLPAWHTVTRTVACPWENKGRVMRRLNEQYRTDTARIDGVRVAVGEDWVLVLPDPDQPVFHVFGDSVSREQADVLAERYARIVETLQT
jgi:mannose-1-phosphate guanylyltransferase/phosphomannomutase